MAEAEGAPLAPKPSGPRLLPRAAWLVGAALATLGVLCIGGYATRVAELWNDSDRSMLYWLSFLPVLGTGLLGAGAFFVAIGLLARRGSAVAIALARYSLIALAALAAVGALGSYLQGQREDEAGRARAEDERLRAHRLHRARRLERLELDVADNQQLTLRARPIDGLDGSYRWTLTLSAGRTVFHEESQVLRLHGPAEPIVRALKFDTLFARCFTQGSASHAHVCARDAGAEDLYIVAAGLELIEDARGVVSASALRHEPIRSTASAELEIDTMTTQREVIVKHVRRLQQ